MPESFYRFKLPTLLTLDKNQPQQPRGPQDVPPPQPGPPPGRKEPAGPAPGGPTHPPK